MKLQLLPLARWYRLIQLGQRLGLSSLLWLSFPASMVTAQVVPDGTLESAVEQIQELMKINGGQRAGNNLFHSFEEFSVPAGMEAAFENATEIENIFTRVTGDSVSAIDGVISAQGGANLFLMNPNGIVFSADASIDIGGSFIATTADSIQFDDGAKFAASDGGSDALINVKFPVAFGFNKEPGGSITVNGVGNNITSGSPDSPTVVQPNQSGLEVKSGRMLGLIGENITIDGGTLQTDGGSIELGSVSSGTVDIQQTENEFAFNYDEVGSYSNISLANQAALNVSGESSGAVSLNGRNISFQDGSIAIIQNRGDSDAGDISLNATESYSGKADSTGEIALITEALSTGKGSDINIIASEIIGLDGGGFSTFSYDAGKGGNINVDALDSVNLVFSGIGSIAFGVGEAGNIKVSTQEIKIDSGGQISSTVVGSGTGGAVNVNSNSIEITGIDERGTTPSFIGATNFTNGSLKEIVVNTSKLKLLNGGTISSGSFSDGSTGNVTVNAEESIEISGKQDDFQSVLGSSVVVISEKVRDRIGLPDQPSGIAGSVAIKAPSIKVGQEGRISVRNEGTGNSGTLSIDTNMLELNNKAEITAQSAFGEGGNININVDTLSLVSGGEITAEAGNQGGGNISINASNISAKKDSAISANTVGGDGGNITIETDTLVGLENSDITANAVQGNGGNIEITADAIIGFEERAKLSSLSDITASSEFGASGVITINAPESSADERVEVAAREASSQDLTKEFAQSCFQGRGRFTYTAMGVPESPDRHFDDSEEYGIEEAKGKIEFPPLGQPQNELHRQEIERTRQNQQGKKVQPQPQPQQVQGEIVVAEINPDTGKGYPIVYTETNVVPPRLDAWRQPGTPRQEANAIQINPNGEHYMVRIAEIQHPQDQVCTTINSDSTAE